MATTPESNVPATQAEPEQKPVVAQQDEVDENADAASDAALDGADGAEGDKPAEPKLTDEQRTIAKQAKRIDKLTAKIGELTRAEQRELAELRQKLAAFEAERDGTEAKPLSQDEFERRARYHARELREQEDLNVKAARVLREGKKLEGFNEARDTLMQTIPFATKDGRATSFLKAVLDTDMPTELIVYLGENDDEAEEYEGLSESQIGRRLALLESKLKRSAIAKKSSAPVPLKPVQASASVRVDEKRLTDAQWAAMRKREKLSR